MKNHKYYLLLGIAMVIYLIPSKILFDRVYAASEVIVDELFHIPQGLAYCDNNMTYWNPKITTLPGLYLVSALFGNFFECTPYFLRSVNLSASVVNMGLMASILYYIYGHRGDSDVAVILQAVNLTILPPLYFFSHVYYTDMLSLMFLLAFFRLCLTNKHKMGIFTLAVFSIMMRQTNVVWVAMVLGHRLLDVFIRSSRVYGNAAINKTPISPLNTNKVYMQQLDETKLKRYYSNFDFYKAVKYHGSTRLQTFFRFLTHHDWSVIVTHGSVLAMFVLFVIVNGSIVVGDKTAHSASLHLAQILYFLLFYGVFGLPYVLQSLPRTLRLIWNSKTAVVLMTVVFLLIVKYNTVVHPYLLADNRHFTFYLWNRWFLKYWFARYTTVPLYVFLFFSLYTVLKDQNCVSFLLPYVVCLLAAVGLQSMIEIRYFLVPYLILRFRFPRPSLFVIFSEFLWYLILNVCAFNVFFTKTFMWSDFKEPQRIIW